MPQVIEPAYELRSFTCPRCGTLAEQTWWRLQANGPTQNMAVNSHAWCICRSCELPTLWRTPQQLSPGKLEQIDGQRVWPVEGGPPPHDDMPAEALRHYHQARAVLGASPQAAAALLRVATEAIAHHLLDGEEMMLDKAIAELMRRDLIRTNVKKACDVLRVTGNSMLHPGQIDEGDASQEVALRLFHLANLIVEQAITEPALIANLYSALPPSKLAGIESRDKRALARRDLADDASS